MVDVVKLASLASIEEAHAIRGLLESNGIQVNIANEQHAQMEWYLVPAFDGIAVQVPSTDFDRAKRTVLQARQSVDEGATDDTLEDDDYFEEKRRQRFNRARLVFFFIVIAPLAFGSFRLFR